MVRLVDEDVLKNLTGVFTDDGFMVDYKAVIRVLEGSAEVIRCKDCKFYRDYYGERRCSVFTGSYDNPFPTDPDDFCSYGERRSDETD